MWYRNAKYFWFSIFALYNVQSRDGRNQRQSILLVLDVESRDGGGNQMPIIILILDDKSRAVGGNHMAIILVLDIKSRDGWWKLKNFAGKICHFSDYSNKGRLFDYPNIQIQIHEQNEDLYPGISITMEVYRTFRIFKITFMGVQRT
jgi:hypothetical protein